MKTFDVVVTAPAGALLVGGHSKVPSGAHAAHAVDERGRPTIPATALRGALRESLEAILRGAGERACAAGTGYEPHELAELAERTATADVRTSDADPPKRRTCMIDGGKRCKACELFGGARAAVDGEERAFSALVLGDAIAAHGAHSFQARPGVAIARRSRAAEGARLFVQRVPSTPGQTFIARGRLLDPKLEPCLLAAMSATKHVGAGRSRGLARIDLEYRSADDEKTDRATLGAGDDVRVRVTLIHPALIGVPVTHKNLQESRDEIPGAALRGAVGFALAAVLDDPDHDDAFHDLVGEGGASFGFLHPVDGQHGSSEPLPITAAACKVHRAAHGVVDTLFDRLAVAVAGDADPGRGAPPPLETCGRCGQPLRSFAGWRRHGEAIPKHDVTRVSLDRRHASARDGQLFTQQLIERGTVFEGTIRNVPASGRAHLARALALPLSLGRGRSADWGRVRIDVLASDAALSLHERAEAFERAIREHLRRAGSSHERAARLVPFTLTSPLVADGDDDGERLLLERFDGATCTLKARRFVREGGWDQRNGRMRATLATAAGGVFVLDVGEGRRWTDVAAQIERVERDGIGLQTHQGYGRVMAFDPIFLQRTAEG